MKLRIFALTLVLAVVAWAQRSSQAPAPNSTPAPETKGCCHHMGDHKDGMGCCHKKTAEGKEAMECCGKQQCDMKDGKSWCEGKDANACMKQCQKENAGCRKDGKCGVNRKGCCGGSNEKTAAGCCRGNHCEHHKPAIAS